VKAYSLLLASILAIAIPAEAADSARLEEAAPAQFITHHKAVIGGTRIAFTATAGETYLYNDIGEPIGSIFSYAYVKDKTSPAERPVMFITGGGPGSASHFLQIGLLGPWTLPPDRLAIVDGKAPSPTPPFGVVENPNSVLDVADLVFIDPIGTGYSRIIGNGKVEDFWGIDVDLESLAQFIQLWLSKNNRWESPKFFLGESYGGTRAALLPNALGGGPSVMGYMRGITLNGVVVLVNGLGYPIGTEGIGPVLQAATDLPNQAATAWYHNKIERRGRSLATFYEEATQFALTQYADVLRKEADNTLTTAERAAVVERITELTGVPASALATKLALTGEEFSKVVLGDRGVQVGVYDSRYTLPQGRVGTDPVADDALLSRTFPVTTGAFLAMEGDKLNVQMNRPFVGILWRDLLAKWNFSRKEWTAYPIAKATNGQELATAMSRNDKLYALIGCGYYDLLMSPAQARYMAESTGMPTDRTVVRGYEGGHEPYVDPAVRTQMLDDIRDLILKASRHR
jgi:carboxypeptidase C (cathepsin A)